MSSKVEVKIDFDFDYFVEDEIIKGQQALGIVAKKTLERMKDDEVIPFDNGTMQEIQTTCEKLDDSNWQIKTVAPQAARLYYNPQFNFQKKNKNAGGYWFKEYGPGGKYYEDVCGDFKKML